MTDLKRPSRAKPVPVAFRCPIPACGNTAPEQPARSEYPPACNGLGKHAPKDMKRVDS